MSGSSAVATVPRAVEAFVLLKGGLAVPVDAWRLALDFEGRGIVLSVEGPDLVVDDPAGAVTDADRLHIRRWKWHLMALTAYRAPEVVM